jgi:hypothetical protein
MKDLPGDDYQSYIEEDEDAPTAMELALREAMEEQGVDLPSFKEQRRRKKSKKRRRDDIQDEIISRTLESHRE